MTGNGFQTSNPLGVVLRSPFDQQQLVDSNVTSITSNEDTRDEKECEEHGLQHDSDAMEYIGDSFDQISYIFFVFALHFRFKIAMWKL